MKKFLCTKLNFTTAKYQHLLLLDIVSDLVLPALILVSQISFHLPEQYSKLIKNIHKTLN